MSVFKLITYPKFKRTVLRLGILNDIGDEIIILFSMLYSTCLPGTVVQTIYSHIGRSYKALHPTICLDFFLVWIIIQNREHVKSIFTVIKLKYLKWLIRKI